MGIATRYLSFNASIMGAAAFLIAEYLKMSYLDIVRMALIPTCLYYFGLLVMTEIDCGISMIGVLVLVAAPVSLAMGAVTSTVSSVLASSWADAVSGKAAKKASASATWMARASGDATESGAGVDGARTTREDMEEPWKVGFG